MYLRNLTFWGLSTPFLLKLKDLLLVYYVYLSSSWGSMLQVSKTNMRWTVNEPVGRKSIHKKKKKKNYTHPFESSISSLLVEFLIPHTLLSLGSFSKPVVYEAEKRNTLNLDAKFTCNSKSYFLKIL